MSNFAKIVATIENLEEVAVIEENIEPIAEEVSNDQAVMAEAEVDVGQINDGLDSAMNASDKLDDLAEVVKENTDEDDSVSEFAQKTVQATYETIMASLGMKPVAFTMESRDGSSLVATLEAESSGILSKAWEGIKAFFNSIIDFIGNLLRSRAGLIKYLTNVKAKLSSLTDDKQLSKSGKTSLFSSPQKAIESVQTAGKCIDLAEGSIFIMREMEKTLKETSDWSNSNVIDAKAKAGEELNASSFNTEIEKALDKEINKVFGTSKGIVGGLPNGKALSVDNFKFTYVQGTTGADAEKSPDLSDLSEIINRALSFANKLKNMDKVDSGIKTLFKSVSNAISSARLSNKAHDEKNNENKKQADNKSKFLRNLSIARLMTRLYGTTLPTIAFKTLRASGDYVASFIGKPAPAGETDSPAAASNSANQDQLRLA